MASGATDGAIRGSGDASSPSVAQKLSCYRRGVGCLSGAQTRSLHTSILRIRSLRLRSVFERTHSACPSVRECRLKSDALRLTICEVDGEEPVRAIETLELHLATLGELDS
jgi:hypothetical protein